MSLLCMAIFSVRAFMSMRKLKVEGKGQDRTRSMAEHFQNMILDRNCRSLLGSYLRNDRQLLTRKSLIDEFHPLTTLEISLYNIFI